MRKNSSIIAERVSGERNPQEYGIIAQLGEHLPYKQRVIGSSPIGPTSNFILVNAGVAELADAQDLKSCGTYTPVPVRFRSAALLRRLQPFIAVSYTHLTLPTIA